jgi:hypothetical protein
MRVPIIALLFCILNGARLFADNIYVFETKPNSLYSIVLKEGSIHYIADDVVNIRDNPSREGKIIGKALIGNEVLILERTTIQEEIYEAVSKS